MSEKIGIIDVGGGMRDIYGAGIFDYLMDNNIDIPYCIGVSAGSANVASYVSGQRGRNFRFYTEYSFEKQYMSLSNYIRKGSYIDLDYVYGTLTKTDGRDPWDYDKAMNSGKEIVVVATDAVSGQPAYFTNKDFVRDDYGMFKGSSCIPIVCKAYNWRGKDYYDGGISDPIPYERALSDGCDRIIVILTRPVEFRKEAKRSRMYNKLKKTFPNMVDKLYERAPLYNNQLETILNEYVPKGKAIVIGPDDVCGVDTIKHKKENLERLYQKGYDDGIKIKEFIEKA